MAPPLAIVRLSERPDLRGAIFGPEIQSAVPEFMRHDATDELYYGAGQLDDYLDFVLAAFDPAEPARPLARACCVPFAWRGELPDGGWDAVIRWGRQDRLAGRRADAVSALEIMVAPRMQGSGVARAMLAAMCDNARRFGFRELWAPLRPTEKEREPEAAFAEYCARRRADGLPADAWVRTHVRAGATIVKPAPCSMTIAGTLAEWRKWTGLAFDRSGAALVPGALVPIHVSLEQDHAVYVEPNLWVRHELS